MASPAVAHRRSCRDCGGRYCDAGSNERSIGTRRAARKTSPTESSALICAIGGPDPDVIKTPVISIYYSQIAPAVGAARRHGLHSGGKNCRPGGGPRVRTGAVRPQTSYNKVASKLSFGRPRCG